MVIQNHYRQLRSKSKKLVLHYSIIDSDRRVVRHMEAFALTFFILQAMAKVLSNNMRTSFPTCLLNRKINRNSFDHRSIECY